MLNQLSRTKVIWAITEQSVQKQGIDGLAKQMVHGPQEAIRAMGSARMLDHLVELRKKMVSIINETSTTKRTAEGFLPYMLPLVGRRARLVVPNNNQLMEAGELVDIDVTANLDDFFSDLSKRKKDRLEILLTSADMHSKLGQGSRLILSYGQVELTVTELKRTGNSLSIKARVDSAGKAITGMDVDSPDLNPSMFPLIPIDEENLENNFRGLADYVIVDGINSEGELQLIRHKLGLDSDSRRHPSVKINADVKSADAPVPPRLILKVDSKTILDMLPKLLPYVDGVLLSRSELGISVHPHYLPIIQKEVITLCNQAAKIVIVASELMYSMRLNPTPTRAEVSDLANAISDGADAVVLAEEVTEGPYPAELAQVTGDTVTRSHSFLDEKWRIPPFEIKNDDDVIAYGALNIAEHSKAKAIVCLTEGGYTALRLASLRAPIPVIAVCYNKAVMRQLSLVRSVHTLLLGGTSFDDVLVQTKSLLTDHFDMHRGEPFIFVSLTASSIAARNSNLFTLQEID